MLNKVQATQTKIKSAIEMDKNSQIIMVKIAMGLRSGQKENLQL